MSVAIGVDRFSRAMAAHADAYVLIGGAACSILFDEAGSSFRLTKDLDVVVLADDADSGFAQDFWKFVKEGGYDVGRRSEGGCTYYRFQLPDGSPYALKLPNQIELFARHPGFRLWNEESAVAPLPFDDAVSSLSAIILDDGYYEFIRANATSIDGVSTLSALSIIPLKMRAHVGLNRKHAAGAPDGTNSKNLRKHRADVANLARLLAESDRLPLAGQMRADAEAFIEDFAQYASRQTNRKQAEQLRDDLRLLKTVYL